MRSRAIYELTISILHALTPALVSKFTRYDSPVWVRLIFSPNPFSNWRNRRLAVRRVVNCMYVLHDRERTGCSKRASWVMHSEDLSTDELLFLCLAYTPNVICTYRSPRHGQAQCIYTIRAHFLSFRQVLATNEKGYYMPLGLEAKRFSGKPWHQQR